MYIFFMRKILDVKNLDPAGTAKELRETAARVGAAAESQARLNIALTAVCVAALLVAVLTVRSAGAGQ